MPGAHTAVHTPSCRQPPPNEAPLIGFMGFDCVLMASKQNSTLNHQQFGF